MKLHLHNDPRLNQINAYGADHVIINGQRYQHNLIVTTTEIVTDWAAGYDELHADDFDPILTLHPQVVLLATGSRQRFPAPLLLRPLIDAGIGFEIMDLSAACRTYNLLVSEGREVAAALLFDPAD